MERAQVVLELGQYEERIRWSGPGCADFVTLPVVVTFWYETMSLSRKGEMLPGTLSV